MANSQNMSQPHIQKKLRQSGALETMETAKTRTRAMEIIDSWDLAEYQNHIINMISHPEDYIHNDSTARAWLSLHPFGQKWVITKKNPRRPAVEEIQKLFQQAEYNVWQAKVNYAQTLPPSAWKIIYGTRWKVDMIMSGLLG